MKKLLMIAAAFCAVAAPAHADPVTAIATWISGTIGVTGATALAIANTVIGIGVSLIASALMPKPDYPGANVSFEVQMGDDLPLTFTVGEYATAGKRKYIKSWGKNTRFITEVIEFSAMPQGLSRMWIDDEPWSVVQGRRGSVPTAFGPDPIESVTGYDEGNLPSGHVDLGIELDNYRDDGDSTNPRMWVKWYDGTQAAADPLVIFAATDDTDYPWTDEMIGTGKAYAVVTVRYDSDSMTSYPAYLFEPEPLPLYDIRHDSTNGGSGSQRWDDPTTWQPTSNAAVISYNIIRGISHGSEWIYGGKGLPAWRLPSAEWIAAANACDDPVSLSGGGTEPRYRCGMEISVDVAPVDVLEEIGRAANMRFAEVGGQIKPVVDLPATSVFAFTDEDIIITEGQTMQPFYPVSETYNALSATYPEPGEKWASKDAAEYIDADATAADGGRYLPTSMSYGAVPFARQVQRLQRSQMRDFRRMRRHQFYLPPEAYALEPGIDTVSWTSARNGYDNKRFMVETVVKTPGMNVLVSLREIDPSDYDWSASFEAPVTITPPKNPVRFTQPINGLTVTAALIEDSDGVGRRPAILVACDGDEAGVTNIQIQGRVIGKDTTIDTTRSFADPYAWYLRDVLPATTYEVRARLLSKLTSRSEWSSWISVTTPDVGLTWADFEDEVRQAVDDAQAQASAAAQAAGDAEANADQVRSDLTAAQSALSDEVEGVRSDLTAANTSLQADIDAAEQLAMDNLNIARDYTDTSVQSEAVARQTATDALAAQINTLTAVLNSENYLENPRFSNGLTGWSGHTSAATVVAQDELSADPIIANVPAGQFVELASNASFNRELLQSFPIDLNAGEVVQWRLHATSAGVDRELAVMVQFLDDGGTSLGHPSKTITLVQDEWRVFSGQEVPPAGTASIRFRVRITATAETDPIAITDVSFTKVDQSAMARITDLEVVVANDQQALATYITTANARFDDAEAAIQSEATTRANETSALSSTATTLSSRIDDADAAISQEAITRADETSALSGTVSTLSSRLDDAEADISQEAIARADADSSLSALITTVESRFDAALDSGNYIRNGTFSTGDFTDWDSVNAQFTIEERDENGNLHAIRSAPTAHFLKAPNTTDQIQLFNRPGVGVQEGQRVLLGFSAAVVGGTQSVWTIGVRFVDAAGDNLSLVSRSMTVTQSGWQTSDFAPIEVPADAVAIGYVYLRRNSGATGASFVTNVTLDKERAFEAMTAAAIAEEVEARSSETGALASQMTTVSAEASRVRTFRNSTAPADPRNGDIWYDTSDHNRPYRWWDDEWLPVEDTRIGTLEASVTTQATAISDLETGASAGYLIKAQAGNSVSLLDLVAADGSGGTASVAKLQADDILLKGSVAADMLTVMDLSGNMVPDAEMVSASSWNVEGDPDWSLAGPGAFGWSQKRSAGEVRFSGGGGSFVTKSGGVFRVVAGEEYSFAASIRRVSGGTVNAGVHVQWLDNSESQLSVGLVARLTDSSGSTHDNTSLVAPNDARFARIRLSVYSGNIGTVGFSGVSCLRKRSGSTLITPGGVTAELITANTMRALNGQFADLAAANIRVGNAEIGTLQIDNNAIYAPYNFSRSDMTISRSRSNPHRIISRTITGFEGGGFSVMFSAVVDTTAQGPDNFCEMYMEIDGVEVSRARFGARAGGGGDVKFAIPAHLFATAVGNSSVTISVYGFSREFNDTTVSSGPLDITNITLSVSGSKR
ncbi:phage tail protein [Paracoccus seriniphilus]|uniref:DUF1983 domain-containing protein n=1 Tax=Paracoccus seriniphilus TaxID=184748 RepID=A0A239Q359_9RHOB|nr:phage tail protein [Paracoccus seriniphilus]WCR13213.1 hypothetical protein JHW44_09695 [Paracoccus seriniphilus]SNT76706.1 hypothetical protein SAMN05444959_12513 [Paracoccus seriniphilus]